MIGLKKREKPYITQLSVIAGHLNKMADEIEDCIDMIDNGDVASARSDLCLIYEELKGESE